MTSTNRTATLWRFLRSLPALSIHILCIGFSLILSIGLMEGNAPPDALTVICFLLITYPIQLGLAWWQFKDNALLVMTDDTDTDDEQAFDRECPGDDSNAH